MEVQVGVTVLIALGVLLWGVTYLKELSLARKVRVWHVVFPQTGGLGKSDEVQVNGIRKGAVQSMDLVGDHVVVDLALSSDVHLTHDSRIAIRNVGLMGEKVIAVDLRSSGAPYTERDTIPGVYELGIPEVMGQLGGTISSVASLAEQVKGIAEILDRKGELTASVRNFRKTSDELQKAVAENRVALRETMRNFQVASGTVRSLTTDRETELKKSLRNFATASERLVMLSGRLDTLSGRISSVTAKVDRGDGTLGRLVNDRKLYNDLSAAVDSLRALVADVKRNPKKYLKVSVF